MELNIFGMKRSGMHGIINWLCEQSYPAIHYNACNVETKQARRFIVEYGYEEFRNINFKKKRVLKKSEEQNGEYKLIIRNYEDVDIVNLENTVVIMREPRNWIASRLKGNLLRTDNRIPTWKKHAKSNHYKILFDKWFISKEYRKEICKKFGIEFTDYGLDDVFWNGKSGFDEHDYDGKAQEMNVLNRWKEFEPQVKKIVDQEMIDLWSNLNDR